MLQESSRQEGESMETKKTKTKTQAKTVKKTASKAAKKPVVENKEEFFFEVNGQQVMVNQLDLKQRIHEIYREEGHRPANIKSLQVYVNLEERKAYYVINGKADGKCVDI